MVQEYLNEISPTIYGPNKPKTLGKPLRIPDLQTPASYHDKPATLYTTYLFRLFSTFKKYTKSTCMHAYIAYA